jgi:large subunit ribosomal protein L35
VNVGVNGNGSDGALGIRQIIVIYQACADRQDMGGGRNMPKMKTHKATAKRFKITGKGKLRRLKGRRSHLRRKKSKRVRRSFDKDHSVDRVDRKRVRRLLGLKQPE